MIHLILGNTGAGKTIYSNKLKLETRGVVFSIDFWNKTLFLPDKTSEDGLAWFLERIERAESVMQHMVDQLESAGTDSILDLGLSKKSHRDKFKAFAESKGYALKIHFLDIPKEIRLARVLKRNSDKGESFAFEVSRADFDFMESWFEPPTGDELAQAIHKLA